MLLARALCASEKKKKMGMSKSLVDVRLEFLFLARGSVFMRAALILLNNLVTSKYWGAGNQSSASVFRRPSIQTAAS